MVCIYCKNELSVVNSRPQKRSNQVWRRRKCPNCGAIFSTTEAINLEGAISVRTAASLKPFSRITLFVSIYESCRHRASATRDAVALTDTVIGKLLPKATTGVLPIETIITTTVSTLKRFDKAASVQYSAFHPLPKTQPKR